MSDDAKSSTDAKSWTYAKLSSIAKMAAKGLAKQIIGTRKHKWNFIRQLKPFK